jgi:hypothetical protein
MSFVIQLVLALVALDRVLHICQLKYVIFLNLLLLHSIRSHQIPPAVRFPREFLSRKMASW